MTEIHVTYCIHDTASSLLQMLTQSISIRDTPPCPSILAALWVAGLELCYDIAEAVHEALSK